MSRSMFVAGLLAAGCFLVSSIAASAKGLPTEVTVTGPGLSAPLYITDPFATSSLGISLMQTDKPLAHPPTDLGSSYEIERDGFDHVRYYPGTSLRDSYVYYEGLINGSSEYDRHWYPVSAAGDTAIRMLLVASGVHNPDVEQGMSPLADGTLARARTVLASPSASPRNGQQQSVGVPVAAWLAFVGVAGVCVGGGLGSLVRARAVRAETTSPSGRYGLPLCADPDLERHH